MNHPARSQARSAARLAAVQALYQMDLAGSDVGETLAQFSARASGENFEDGQCGEADYRHLKDVVDGVVREQKMIQLQESGLLKVRSGDTSLEEVQRIFAPKQSAAAKPAAAHCCPPALPWRGTTSWCTPTTCRHWTGLLERCGS